MNRKYRIIASMLAIVLAITSGVVGVAAATGETGSGAGDLDCSITDPDRSCSELSYTVHQGDTLSQISRDYNVPVNNIVRANSLKSTTIYPGQDLIIPGASVTAFGQALSRGVSRDEIKLLARLIHAEARGENFEGKVAVGAVILNRLASNEFPNSIRDIIMQSNGRVYQFSPVQDGSIYLEPDEESTRAALQALTGHDPSGGALFFYNPKVAKDKWIRTLPVVTRIGNHVFATKI